MSLVLLAISILASAIVGRLFLQALREPNEGGFWDANNPSGFHRFVPPTFAAVVAAFVVGLVWSMSRLGGL